MNSYLHSTMLTVFAPHNHSSCAIPFGCTNKTHFHHCHNQIRRPKSKRSSITILSSQNNKTEGNYNGSLSSALEKPRKNFQDDTYNTTTTADRNHSDGIGIYTFLEGKNFLITGATGFVAKVFIEKILRTVPDVEKIFLLIKAKDKEAALERLRTEIIECELFQKLQEVHGKYYEGFMMRKLVAVAGNVCESNLGIDADIADEIAKRVDVIINSAANTKFDERFDVALNINTKGPSRLLSFAKTCKKICVFLHISTAYVNGERQGIIKEKPFYMGQSIARERETSENEVLVPMLDIEAEIKLASKLMEFVNENEATQKMKKFGVQRAKLHGWANIYSFTKAMGEMLINSTRGDIPVVIVRPTAIKSTYREPFPGWIQGNRVLDPFILSYGKGQLSGMFADPEAVLDVVPVDMVVNAAIAAMAKHGTASRSELNVYHIGSSMENPISIGNIFEYAYDHFKSYPLLDSKGNEIGLFRMSFFSSMYNYSSYISSEMTKQSEPMEATALEPKLYRKLKMQSKKRAEYFTQMAKIYGPYMFYNGRFDNGNTQKLMEEMSNEEIRDFWFNMKSVNWQQYFSRIHIPGLRKHILKKELVSSN